MTPDVFYATLKLVSGEELLAKVCAFIENDEVMIVLDHPIFVNIMMAHKSRIPMIKVLPWNALSTDSTHIIRRNHILTMSEVKDKNLVKIHNQYMEDIKSSFTSSNFSLNSDTLSHSGQFSTVDEARITLEKIYQSKESPTNSD